MMKRHELTYPRRETLYGELHTLLSAGVDFSEAFSLLIEAERGDDIEPLLKALYADVVAGYTLRQAMERSGAFPALDCGVTGIGEQTGRLVEALEFLTDYYRKRVEQRRMISSALGYPIVVLCTALAVTIFMLFVVVPTFEQVYSRMGGELPALTRAIISFAEAFPRYATVTAAAGLVVVAYCRRYRNDRRMKEMAAAALLRIPVAGTIVRLNAMARICRLLDLLCRSGIPLLTGVRMVAEATDFPPYGQSLEQTARLLERGESFAKALGHHTSLYDKRLVAMIGVGERTNRLPQMLRKQGEDLTAETERAVRRIGTMLEPILILFVGALVAVILIAMYMPMFRLGEVVR